MRRPTRGQVPAGSHVVEFTYRPAPVIAGGAVPIVALLAVTGWALKGAVLGARSGKEEEVKTAKPEDLLTAGAIAKALGAPEAKVKKAIKDLGLKPKAKKGVCSYYGQDAVAKVRAAVAP